MIVFECMQSVQDLSHRLASARRVVVLGNGGIALEIVHEVSMGAVQVSCANWEPRR
jgi:hypothetical protein